MRSRLTVAALVAAALLVPRTLLAQPQPGDVLYKGTKVVTMDGSGKVIDHGAILVRGGKIVSILPANAPTPPGAKVVDTGGVIYPGMLDLHDHTAYNFIPPEYAPPKDYG